VRPWVQTQVPLKTVIFKNSVKYHMHIYQAIRLLELPSYYIIVAVIVGLISIFTMKNHFWEEMILQKSYEILKNSNLVSSVTPT
jgi:hypothetical protein